jgi:predicted PurR-regulated permease PerM
VRFFIGLALLAGFANFIPYLGVSIAWITFFLVAFFQGTTAFGLDPFVYALIVTGLAWIIDNTYDNVFTPRVMGGALNLHPAFITIGALVGLNLFGLIGMILAAPLLASLRILLRYSEQKMLDQDPWKDFESFSHVQASEPIIKRVSKIISREYKQKNKKG